MSTDVSEVRAASIIREMSVLLKRRRHSIKNILIALMMEAARISETSVDIQLRTR
jgi:hypothetical protein